MARSKPRFDYAVLTSRVEAARAKKGITAKDLMAKVALDAPRWYRKMKGTGSTFTLEEFGAIADALDAPEGWPFVER